MDQVYGEAVKEIHILENGKMVKHMDMEFIHGLMEIDIKVNLNNVLNMDKAFKNLIMVTIIKDHIKMENHMVMVSIIGMMAVHIKVILFNKSIFRYFSILYNIIGNFINGLRNGKGVWKKSIGESDIYEGEFVDEKK